MNRVCNYESGIEDRARFHLTDSETFGINTDLYMPENNIALYESNIKLAGDAEQLDLNSLFVLFK